MSILNCTFINVVTFQVFVLNMKSTTYSILQITNMDTTLTKKGSFCAKYL